ncbi:MAG: hypothetical protein ABW178_09955 [Pseudoxanthomonas sp.]
MHHARQHAETKARERRRRLAHEAARLIAEGGLRDYHQAKLKAASRLGIHDDASLPRNREIEDALREYQRLFDRDHQPAALRTRRHAALQAMKFFSRFEPRLVGSVLDGTADGSSPVQLHLHSDDPDEVTHFLEQHGIPAEARTRRLRRDRYLAVDFPVWLFVADDVTFDVTVLPYDVLRQAPLSAIDEKPMRRASGAHLKQLLLENDPSPFDAV